VWFVCVMITLDDLKDENTQSLTSLTLVGEPVKLLPKFPV